MLRAIRRYGDLLEQIVASVALVCIILLIFTAVVLRYFFASGIIWGEEISRVLFIGMTYIAMSRVDLKGVHFRVSVIHEYLPQLKLYLTVLVSALQLGLLVYLSYLALNLTMFVRDMGQRLPAADLPSYYFYVPIVVGLALAALRSLEGLASSIAAIRRRGT